MASSSSREIKLSSSALDVQNVLELSSDQWKQFETVTRTYFQKRYEQYLRQENRQDIQYDLIPDSLINSIRQEILSKIYKDFHWARNVNQTQLDKAMTWKFRKSAKNKRDKLRRTGGSVPREDDATGSPSHTSNRPSPSVGEGGIMTSIEGDHLSSSSPVTESGTLEQISSPEENGSQSATSQTSCPSSNRGYYDPVRDRSG